MERERKKEKEKEKERERERERERETHTHRDTDRQTDRQTHTHNEKKRKRQRETGGIETTERVSFLNDIGNVTCKLAGRKCNSWEGVNGHSLEMAIPRNQEDQAILVSQNRFQRVSFS